MSASFYDEVEIEDFEWDPLRQLYHYPCPCGDRFQIALTDLMAGEDVASCPSCSLIVRVIYDMDSLQTKTKSDANQVDSTSETVALVLA